MEYLDSDKDFCLTQTSTRSYCETNCSQFGSDLVDNCFEDVPSNGNLVSLENGIDQPNFELELEFSQTLQPKKLIYDNVEIEDISSCDELDSM